MEVLVPVVAAKLLLEFGIGHLMVVGGGVAQLHAALGRFGHACLHGHHRLHLAQGGELVVAQQLKHLHDVLLEGLAYLCECRVVAEVILLLSQREAALSQTHDVGGGVHHVGIDVCAPQLVCALFGVKHHQALQLVAVLDVGDGLEVGLDGGDALFVLADGVHHHAVEVANLLRYTALLVLLLRKAEDELLYLLAVGLSHGVEGAEAGILRLEGVVVNPSAAGIAIEVGAGLNGLVHVANIHSVGVVEGLCCGCSHRSRQCKCHNDFHIVIVGY